MCNYNPITPCLNCQQGITCNCPPVYPVPNTVVPCNCCPPGYSYQGVTPNWPNGYCTDNATGKIQIATIPCVVCDEVTTTDCVTYSGIIPLTCNPSGINPGDSITTIINKLCFSNPQNIMAIINAITTNQTLYDGFCNAIAGCGIPGSTVPIIGSISWVIP
jgi:hypothetical protein